MTVNGGIETFGGLVGDIYECALDPGLWPNALGAMCEALGAVSGALGLHNVAQLRNIIEFEVGTDPHYQELFATKYVAIAPFIVAVNFCKPGEAVSVGDVIDYDEFREGRFYKEWAQPQGWEDNIVGIISKSADQLGYFGASLKDRARDDQKQLMMAFLPHLERAVRISNILEFRAVEAGNLASVVDGLASGVVLVDAALNVRSINPAAEIIISARDSLEIVHGRLRLPRTPAGDDLLARIAQCQTVRPGEVPGSAILFDGISGGIGLLCHVLPLPRRRNGQATDAVAALFLTDPVAQSGPPIEAVVKHFALTPSETRVLLGLLGGHNPTAIADMHGIAMPTIRTHLRRLYEKTGTTGQTDLVKLLMSLRPAH